METSREHLCPCCGEEKDLKVLCGSCGNRVCEDCYHTEWCDNCESGFDRAMEKD